MFSLKSLNQYSAQYSFQASAHITIVETLDSNDYHQSRLSLVVLKGMFMFVISVISWAPNFPRVYCINAQHNILSYPPAVFTHARLRNDDQRYRKKRFRRNEYLQTSGKKID